MLSFLPFHHPAPATSTANPQSESTTSPPEDDPHGPRVCSSALVALSGSNRTLNEFSITRPAEPPAKNHLVMIHGYGAGLAFFFRNFDALSRRPGWKLWSLDLLGYGRSSRPPFTIRAKDPDAKISEAEDWFIDALEEWREQRGIDKFTLLGIPPPLPSPQPLDRTGCSNRSPPSPQDTRWAAIFRLDTH